MLVRMLFSLVFFSLLALTPSGILLAEPKISHLQWLEMTWIEKEALGDDSGKLHDYPTWFTPFNTSRPKVPRRMQVIGDRLEYLADDPVGQFLVYFIGQNHHSPGAKLVLEVVAGEKENGKVVASQTVSPLPTPKLAFLLETSQLEPGTYSVCARLKKVPGARKIQGFTFKKSADARKVLPYPEGGIKLLVHEQSHLPDGVWPITTGVPLPRLAVNSVDRFVLLENGQAVNAQFTARATWYPHQQIKWMGLDFLARYDGGKPRDYRLIRLPEGDRAQLPHTPLRLTETADAYVISTGAIQFKVSRRAFAGIEDVCLLQADGSLSKPLVSGPGGPFLVDERHLLYLASMDENVQVTVEEAGPIRVTLYATGWYHTDHAEKNCIYQTRISAYAGQPWIHVNHRTILTFDTDRKKIRALGFMIRPAGAQQWRFGADGQTLSGILPDAGKDARGQSVPADSVWLHQDRWDRFRLMKGASQFPIPKAQPPAEAIATGKKSDGWATVGLVSGSMTVMARSLWQLFPKEIELSRDAAYLHVWPRHGHVSFTEEEELARRNLHKLYYAHQGKYLDLKFPEKYFDALRAHASIIENQDINALTGNGQGLAASNDFCFYFQGAEAAGQASAVDGMTPLAELYKQDPHAITDPVWNGLTGVEGRFAGRDPQRFPELERVFDDGYRGFTMSPDILEAYGMWIWPDTHNNWNPVTKETEMHRWWVLSHYQSVWESQFLYWRSGIPWIYRWAKDYTRHFMDVGTVNYDDPANPLLGKLTGAAYHCKGFTPWGSPRQWERVHDDYVEVGAHFIDPGAYLFSYLLQGDHHGLELARAWASGFGRVELPPERSRECNTALGEMVSYYTATWDPQAILYIRDLADDHNSRPWPEIPAHPGHTLYHDRWVLLYWELTRDPLLQQRLLEWFKPGAWSDAYPLHHALAWDWTGDKTYLTEILPGFAGFGRGVYDNPGDPLHGYHGRYFFFPTNSMGQMAPYFMQALIDAGLHLPSPDSTLRQAVPIGNSQKPEKGKPGNWFVPPAGKPYAHVGYLQPLGGPPVIELELLAVTDYRYAHYGIVNAVPGYYRIEDAEGRVLLETTVLSASKRPKASVTLDAAKSKSPWKIYRYGHGELQWSGAADQVIFAPTPEEAAKDGIR